MAPLFRIFGSLRGIRWESRRRKINVATSECSYPTCAPSQDFPHLEELVTACGFSVAGFDRPPFARRGGGGVGLVVLAVDSFSDSLSERPDLCVLSGEDRPVRSGVDTSDRSVPSNTGCHKKTYWFGRLSPT